MYHDCNVELNIVSKMWKNQYYCISCNDIAYNIINYLFILVQEECHPYTIHQGTQK
jgi:hypothetical protein